MEIGIDCVEIPDFSEKILTKKRILDRVFTENERSYCENKMKPAQHYAVIFAAKEAIIKAFSNYGIDISFNKIEILHKENGAPFVELSDDNDKLKDFEVKISLSHSNNIAVAFTIVQKDSDAKP
jgi:holo-[acyl-carrier protein] synthase